jgi:hypothetical protein
MKVEVFRQSFEKEIAEAASPVKRVETIAASLGNAFAVGNDEIALFAYDSNREVLVFVWPHSLKSVGSIPLNAHRCLVAKTAVERQAGLDNRFASTPHLYMFEHFLADKEKRIPIQKIMSVPVMHGEQLKGVVQVAKKGADRDSAGVDFSAMDLQSLTEFVGIIARYY